MDFRAKKFLETESSYSDKRFSSPQTHSNPKCVCTKQQRCKICEVETERIEEKTDKFTIIVGDFIAPLSIPDGTIRYKISEGIEDSSTINQQNLINNI